MIAFLGESFSIYVQEESECIAYYTHTSQVDNSSIYKGGSKRGIRVKLSICKRKLRGIKYRRL
jgi:hypothetical protein